MLVMERSARGGIVVVLDLVVDVLVVVVLGLVVDELLVVVCPVVDVVDVVVVVAAQAYWQPEYPLSFHEEVASQVLLYPALPDEELWLKSFGVLAQTVLCMKIFVFDEVIFTPSLRLPPAVLSATLL